MIRDQMKIAFPKSSFLGMAKDTEKIIEKLLENKNLLKLLYYSGKDVYDKPDLTEEQIQSLFKNKQISNIPNVSVNENKLSYLLINFNNFVPSDLNPFYKDHILEFKILVHFDNWSLEGFELRPYRIAGEIDSVLDDAKLSGIGTVTFFETTQDVYDDEYAGLSLRYVIVRGNEDKQ